MQLFSCRLIVTLYIYGHVAGDDFRPTPIPLDEWRPDERRGRAGTLHETIRTEPTTSVAIPAHYWEDALRHSVYLTLVRDKIDQLIAKGDATTSNKNHAKDVDDQDLWEKVKAAPFERLAEAEPTTYGDVTILARGRLLEERRGFRFAEDDRSKEKCDEEKCMDGVKAFWSVKRVRQRDQEITPGRYHYELTFSVMSQLPRRQKPYEHLIRTFTVQENDKEQETTHHKTEAPPQARPERAIWFHKNIQTPQHRKRPPQSGLDRLFSSWFDYDDEEEEQPRRFKQTYHPPSHYSKAGYVGGASSEQYSQKTLPYPYKHHGKYQSHPLTTPPMNNIHHQYINPEVGDNYPHILHNDYNQSVLNNQRTSRPAVLPTPLPPITTPSKDMNNFKGSVKYDIFDNITDPPENVPIHKHYNKMRTPVRVNAYPDLLRPPIYNAPPGVFVTSDKKPFKPMPPMKIPIAKPLRSNRPIDFRPSPQVLDVQFSEPDPSYDTAFRPITVSYSDTTSSTEKSLATEDNEKGENTIRKTTVAVKKPPKKHDNAIKSQRVTTTTPDIITANNNPEQEEDMEWADILGIFTRTTPMESQREKTKTAPTTTSLPTTTVSMTTSKQTTTEVPTTAATSTIKPKKRTRPPTKFNKAEKIKKHKRVTTTTTSTTTTDVPSTTKIVEVKHRKKIKQEITKQASSTVPVTAKPKWEPPSKRTTTTPISTIPTTTTASPMLTTKLTTTTTMEASDPEPSTTRPKSQNRFRQSTLILKGTSVKHDRWTQSNTAPEKQREQSTSSFTHRRKGSNFQGYVSSTPKILDEVRNVQHIDYGTSATTLPTVTTKTEESTIKYEKLSTTTTPAYEETNETSMDDIDESDALEDKSEENYEESKDRSEYIFQSDSNKSNEILDEKIEPQTTEKVVITTTHAPLKIKKCKRKQQSLTTSSTKAYEVTDYTTTNAPSTTPLTTSNILEGLLNDFSFDDSSSEETTTQKQDLDKEQSQFHEQYFEVNDDLDELLESLKNNDKYEELSDDEYEEDDDDDEDDEEEHAFDEDTSFTKRNDSPSKTQDDDNNKKRPLTLLELMTME